HPSRLILSITSSHSYFVLRPSYFPSRRASVPHTSYLVPLHVCLIRSITDSKTRHSSPDRYRDVIRHSYLVPRPSYLVPRASYLVLPSTQTSTLLKRISYPNIINHGFAVVGVVSFGGAGGEGFEEFGFVENKSLTYGAAGIVYFNTHVEAQYEEGEVEA